MSQDNEANTGKVDDMSDNIRTGRTFPDLLVTLPLVPIAFFLIIVMGVVIGMLIWRSEALMCSNGAILAASCDDLKSGRTIPIVEGVEQINQGRSDSNSTDELVIRTLKEQIGEYRRKAEQAMVIATTRSPQLNELDPSGPWGIKWKWISPNCEGGYNMVVDEERAISVFGKSGQLDGGGETLLNGRFYVKFTIENRKYVLTADGSIGSNSGEAQLHEKANPAGEPYCHGPIRISRGKLPEDLVGGGNGN